MAVADMFLSIDGVTGESQGKSHEGWIDIFSFSWGASNATSSATGGGSAVGKVSIHDFTISKLTDKASTSLFQAITQGKHYAKATFVMQEAGGDNPVQYLQYDFTQLYVTSLQKAGHGGGDKPTESVSFSFATIKETYQQQSGTGSGSKAGEWGWNVVANTKL